MKSKSSQERGPRRPFQFRGETLARARTMARQTQASLADNAGVSEDTVGRAEKSEPVSQESALAIAAILGIDLEEFGAWLSPPPRGANPQASGTETRAAGSTKSTKPSPSGTVVIADLKDYSPMARNLAAVLGEAETVRLDVDVQSLIEHALIAVGGNHETDILIRAGDGALLLFDEAVQALKFAEELHVRSRSYSAQRKVSRDFKIGMGTGPVGDGATDLGTALRGSLAFTRAGRLQPAAHPGGTLIDRDTWDAANSDQRAAYTGPEKVRSKHAGETFVAYRSATRREPDGFSGSDSSSPATSQFDSQARFAELKTRIGEAVASSAEFLERVARKFEVDAATEPTLAIGERISGIVDRLLDWPFMSAVQWLGECLRDFEGLSDRKAVDATRRLSRLLIPWLYLASVTNAGPAAREGPDGFIALHAGIESFAEIIRAGLENRETFFRKGWDDDFPPGHGVVSFSAPGGVAHRLEESIRTELFRIARPPARARLAPAAVMVEAINRQLERQFVSRGVRPYLIVPLKENPNDQLAIESELHRIRSTYPLLLIVRLNDALLLDHQDLFNDIRDLLLPEEQ